MKKRILSILLLLSVVCLFSCQDVETGGTGEKPTGTTEAQPPEDPSEDVVIPGMPYLTAQYKYSISAEGVDGFVRPTRENRQAYKTFDERRSYKEENVPDIAFEWNSLTLAGKYVNTDADLSSATGRIDFAREYNIPDYGYVCYDLEGGCLTALNFRLSKIIDQNPTTPKLTRDECREIALSYIENYITEYALDIDLSEYVLRESSTNLGEYPILGTVERNSVPSYDFVYEKYANGYRLNRSAISISISEYGSLVFFRWGDDFSSLEEKLDNIDVNGLKAKLGEIAEKIVEKYPDMEFSYTLGEQEYFKKAFDGNFLYICDVRFYSESSKNPDVFFEGLEFTILL